MFDFKEQYIRQVFESYFTKAISHVLPGAIRLALKEHKLLQPQEFVAIKEAAKNYGLSVRTLYNYHQKGHITLRSTEGKTFVSIVELEEHIRKNPVVRNPY